MAGKKGRGEFRRYIEADLGGGSSPREDLYFSAKTSTLMGIVALVGGIAFRVGFLLLSGIVIVGIGLVLFVFLLDDFLRWRSYQRKAATSNASIL